jgi:hypothetical protein
MPAWLHFVPWHLLLWLSVPAGAAALAWALAPEAALAFVKAVPKRIWVMAIVLGAAVLYHQAAVTAAQVGAEKNADARWEKALAAAKDKAKQDHDALQSKIDLQATPSNAALHDQFDKLQATLDDMKRHPGEYAVPKPAKPLPADCKLDPAVVAAANAALRQ